MARISIPTQAILRVLYAVSLVVVLCCVVLCAHVCLCLCVARVLVCVRSFGCA